MMAQVVNVKTQHKNVLCLQQETIQGKIRMNVFRFERLCIYGVMALYKC